jgi:hypothetical protein
MTHTRPGLLALAIAAALVVPAGAQEFETRAPTPADWAALGELPDFTGVWEVARGRGGGRGGAGQSLTPEAAARQAAFLASPPEDNQTANCLPPGMPGIMGQPYPMEFLLTPGKVTIVIEAYTQVRHIYTDGRPLPDDPDPGFFGTSVGRWEGKTLVVETVGFSPLTDIARGVPHGGRMRIVERFSLAEPDLMAIETVVTDPDVLTEPFASTRMLARHRDWTIAEYICEENNRNFVDEGGKAGIVLDDPGGLPTPR